MEPIRHLVVATDLSPASLGAVDRAFDLARTVSARCTVVNALGLNALGPLRGLLGEQADAVAARLVERRRGELQALLVDPARHRGVSWDMLVAEGLPGSVVPAFAAEGGADLVAVGSRGERTLHRMLIGSTASHLLRRSHCPVLVVKAPCHRPYRRVLVPVDFSPASTLAVRFARALVPAARIDLLNVFDVPFEGLLGYAGVGEDVIHRYRVAARRCALQQLHALADISCLAPGDGGVLTTQGDATAEILAHAAQGEHDLIVMGKHGTHVSEDLLLGSVTRRVLEEADADLLAVVDRSQRSAS